MIINISAGHNPDGKIACGAVGLIKESTEARKVKDYLITLLKKGGHTAYDCTIEDGINQANVLTRIITRCNAHKADLDISIHFNAGRADLKGDNKIGGTEVLVYSNSSKTIPTATKVCKRISELGYTNRGVKVEPSLYFLRKSAAPAMLIECCFVDDKDDVKLYNYKSMAEAIYKGIIG